MVITKDDFIVVKEFMPRGRPRVLTDVEKKDAIRRSKSKYMLNKEWYCEMCKTGRNYTLAGKHCHLKTMKHQNNIKIHNMKEQIDMIT